MSRPLTQPTVADVCLVLEGTYPYVGGGVSTWVHDLIRFQPDTTFHLVCLLPRAPEDVPVYDLPANVVGMTHVNLQQLPAGASRMPRQGRFFHQLGQALVSLQNGGDLTHFSRLIHHLAPHRGRLGQRLLMESPQAWEMIQRIYEQTQPDSPFLEFFWTWRTLFTGLYATLLAPLPPARVYHTTCTGYAGLYTARAVAEMGATGIVTEHGIYTNERRVEIAMADWIHQAAPDTFDLTRQPRGLKEMWKETFGAYSKVCYGAVDHILTIFGGNQAWQHADGADPAKMCVIPNGVEVERFQPIARRAGRPPTVGLVGRVVPIKDIQTYIRACGALRRRIHDLRALVVGPVDEDPDYSAQCKQIVAAAGLTDTVQFTGRQQIDDVLAEIDVCVLTSISEGQPLIILEAGAAGIPFVATDVGACRELIYGRLEESPNFGPGGIVTPLADPGATASAMEALLADPARAAACGEAMRRRVAGHYDKTQLIDTYRDIYRTGAVRASGPLALSALAA